MSLDEFLSEFEDKSNKTLTENRAVARKTSGSDLVDFFAKGGALRTRDAEDIKAIFTRAFSEDELLALKCLFYLRDVREGMGERRVFRIIWKYIADRYPEIALINLDNVPFFGRWDDLYSSFDTEIEKEVADYMYNQLQEDIKAVEDGGNPSLLAKWLKSENASSDETKRLARKTIEHFDISPKKYRKILSKLREEIKVVEKLMSENRWDEIDYERVPSKASMIYQDAFRRHDPEGYEEYLQKVESGDAKINADTLFPYEIVRRFLDFDRWSEYFKEIDKDEVRVLEQQWQSLPQYDCTESNAIAVVDVSGSMYNNGGLPISVALSLGLYLAEHNGAEGVKDRFITFSRNPQMVKIKGNDIQEKLMNMAQADWEMNTDIEAVFDLILDIALEKNLSQDEIPQKIYIISDMEFDEASGWGNNVNKTLFEKIADRYNQHGYSLPLLVFWNVDSRNDQLPVKMDERGFQLVSGLSQNLFKYVVDNDANNAYELMLEVLNDERYNRVKIPE